MNLSLSEERVLIKEALSSAIERHCTPDRLRAAERLGHDPALWRTFHEFGLPLMRVPADKGGAALGLLDAVIVADTLGEHLAPIPAIDVIVAARLLHELDSTESLAELAGIAGGGIVAVALHDAEQAPEQFMAWAAAARTIIFRRGADIFLTDAGPEPENERSPANIGGTAARKVRFDPASSVLLGSGDHAVAAFCAAVEEWKLLNAAAMVAMARKALADACDYARQRHAFGRPIGSYQGLAHPLADSSVDVDGASLLIWRTVEAIGLGNSEAAAMVSMSAWWASQVCLPATVKAMRAFGGFGMAMELNAQLFFRRVTAAALTMGDPARELQRAGRRLWGADRDAPLPAAGKVEISFEPPESAQTPVEATRLIFENHITDERREKSFSSGDGFDPELYYALAKDGLLFPDWPEEYGGGGHSSATRAAVRGVYAENGWSDTIISVADMVGQLIINYGSDRAKLDILPKLASGEACATLCFTEPSCGSDIFAAQTRAVRHGSDWIIDGQKAFTSQGHLAQYGLMLARTGDAAKHDSITLFVLPLSQPGYACHPIETIGGERTNTTFYENMRVPDAYRLGEVNGGAKVLASALTLEHGSADLFVAALGEMLDAALSWARTTLIDGRPAIENPEVLAALASVATRLAITDALNRRTVWAVSTANHRKHYGPSAKLFGSESWKSSSLELMNLTAPYSLFQEFDALGKIEKLFRRAVPSTIYAGTSEIQRSLIAESSLGLPRSRS